MSVWDPDFKYWLQPGTAAERELDARAAAIRARNKRIEMLHAEVRLLKMDAQIAQVNLQIKREAIERRDERIAALEAALQPFASFADGLDYYIEETHPDVRVPCDGRVDEYFGSRSVSSDAFLAARAALAGKEKQK